MEIEKPIKTPQWELRLRSIMPNLGARERRFGEYLLAKGGLTEGKPIAVLATEAQVSEATIVRLCHKMGYAGLKDYKRSLIREQSHETPPVKCSGDTLLDGLKQQIFQGSIQSLQSTLALLENSQLLLATEAICRANHISIYAVGGSVPVARSLKHQLMKLGLSCNVNSELQASIIAAEKYGTHDVAVAISNSGETPRVVKALESAHNKGAVTLCITNYANSTITRNADIQLYTTALPLLGGEDHSTARVAQTAIVNLLYLCIAKLYNRYQP